MHQQRLLIKWHIIRYLPQAQCCAGMTYMHKCYGAICEPSSALIATHWKLH